MCAQAPSSAGRKTPELSAHAQEFRALKGPPSTAAGPAAGAAADLTRNASGTAAADKDAEARKTPAVIPAAEPLLNGKVGATHSDDEEAAWEEGDEQRSNGKRNGMLGSKQPAAKGGRLAGVLARLENGSAHNGGTKGAPPLKGHDASSVGKLLAAVGKHPAGLSANGHIPALAPPVDAAE